MRKVIIIATVAIVAASVATLTYIASIGGFDPSKRIISDTVEGMETKIQESPASPSHPAFPPSEGTVMQDNSS